MAVQAQFGGLVFPVPPYAAGEEQQMRPLKDYGPHKEYGALLMSAEAAAPVGDDAYAWQQYDYCAAQSELTCNNAGGMAAPTRKRGREDDDDELLHFAAFLPLPVMRPHSVSVTPASTSGRPAEVPAEDALASELWRHDAEVDALVRAECDRLRAGLDASRKRQRHALVGAALSGLARRAREAEAQLKAARRRAAELEERVRLADAEAQAWCDVARGHETAAAGLRATLDALLLRSSTAVAADECKGFGESEPSDAESRCCDVEAADDIAGATASSSSTAKRACRACGGGEASVLVLPCRHLCLCKACERRTDACPVCAGAKNAALHIGPN